MSTTDPDATAVMEAVPAAEPAPEPAAPEAPEVAEVKPIAEEPREPALDLAGLARLSARAAEVLAAPWPVMAAPVIFTPESRASVSEYDRSVRQAEESAHADHADAYRAGMDAANGRLDDYLAMRSHYEPAAA
jgi:hypothetical protein